jgi:hypothetical protein
MNKYEEQIKKMELSEIPDFIRETYDKAIDGDTEALIFLSELMADVEDGIFQESYKIPQKNGGKE